MKDSRKRFIDLKTSKKYVFISKLSGEIYIQSSRIVNIKYISDTTRFTYDIQNYVEGSKAKCEISVEDFNKLQLSYVGEL